MVPRSELVHQHVTGKAKSPSVFRYGRRRNTITSNSTVYSLGTVGPLLQLATERWHAPSGLSLLQMDNQLSRLGDAGRFVLKLAAFTQHGSLVLGVA